MADLGEKLLDRVAGHAHAVVFHFDPWVTVRRGVTADVDFELLVLQERSSGHGQFVGTVLRAQFQQELVAEVAEVQGVKMQVTGRMFGSLSPALAIPIANSTPSDLRLIASFPSTHLMRAALISKMKPMLLRQLKSWKSWIRSTMI